MVKPWTHWGTSRDTVALRLPSHDAGSGLAGRALGFASVGGPFAYDPFRAYRAGLVTNPNMVVAGAIGMGKSTIVKMVVGRALADGQRVVVIDPKGEYEPLARAHEQRSLRLGRDAWCHPFGGSLEGDTQLLATLLALADERPLSVEEHYDLRHAVAACGDSRSLPRAVYDLVHEHLADEAPSAKKQLALRLDRFIHGDFAGVFDGEGDPVDFAQPLTVVDLSSQWHGSQRAVVALATLACAQRVLGARVGPSYVVLDEAWALLSDEGALRWLQGSWKLARSRAISHVLVLHRWSDIAAVGDAGTRTRALAEGLLRECETTWLLRQPPDEAREMADVLGLHPREAAVLVGLTKGSVLVRYGAVSSVVRIEPTGVDLAVIDTDEAMREG